MIPKFYLFFFSFTHNWAIRFLLFSLFRPSFIEIQYDNLSSALKHIYSQEPLSAHQMSVTLYTHPMFFLLGVSNCQEDNSSMCAN